MNRRKLFLVLGAVAALALAAGAALTTVAATREAGPTAGQAIATQEGAPRPALGGRGVPQGGPEARQETQEQRPWLGLRLAGVVGGLLVTGVVPDSPAAQAGVLRGDLITQVDGSSIATARELREKLRSAQVGQSITLAIKRNGDTKSIAVTLAARPKPARPLLPPRLGLLLEEREGKLVVMGILPDSAAQQGGLQRGDAILTVGGQVVTTTAQLREALKAAEPGSSLSLEVQRGDQRLALQVAVPQAPSRPGFPPGPMRRLLPELEGKSFQGGQLRYDGVTVDLVVGTLDSISAQAVVVQGRSFPLAENALLIRQRQKAQPSDFQAGDPVRVVALGGQARLVASPPGPGMGLGLGVRPGHHHMRPFQFQGRGRGMAPHMDSGSAPLPGPFQFQGQGRGMGPASPGFPRFGPR